MGCSRESAQERLNRRSSLSHPVKLRCKLIIQLSSSDQSTVWIQLILAPLLHLLLILSAHIQPLIHHQFIQIQLIMQEAAFDGGIPQQWNEILAADEQSWKLKLTYGGWPSMGNRLCYTFRIPDACFPRSATFQTCRPTTTRYLLKWCTTTYTYKCSIGTLILDSKDNASTECRSN